MSKNKKKYNWKNREVVNIQVDDSETKKIKLDIDVGDEHYDTSNPLVLPSKKRKTSKKTVPGHTRKLLSNKQRKLLEKKVEKKKKKIQRQEILDSLQQVQASSEELALLTPIYTIQTKGLKRHFADMQKEDKFASLQQLTDAVDEDTITKKKGWCQGKKYITEEEEEEENNPNVVGFQVSDDESEDEEEKKDDEEEKKIENEDKTESGKDSDCEILNNSSCSSLETKPCEEDKTNVAVVSSANISSKDTTSNTSVPVKGERKPAVFIPIHRKPGVQEARMKLPILAEEQEIMETIMENQFIIVAGETGSGKTTQVPQFLYEAGFACDGKMIAVTEPRRVAAISMSRRVAEEMNLSSAEVSYQIRYEGNVTNRTRIKFMTDGVLLKEIEKDFLLKKYSVVIIDEAHERSIFTDILIGLLSRIVPQRIKKGKPLKLIIMSATLRIEDFTENPKLFKQTPPVIKIESRQYPVTIHFNRRTPYDYVTQAFKKVCRIHKELPEGGILVFVTGQQEVNVICRKLKKAFPFHKKEGTNEGANDKDVIEGKEDSGEKSDDDKVVEEELKNLKKLHRKKSVVALPSIKLDYYSEMPPDDTEAEANEDPELTADIEELQLDEEDEEEWGGTTIWQPVWVLPLYSMLSSDRQAMVFQPPPEGTRLCVVATNVAETSLTIPNIKYVVDTGKTKRKFYDKFTGISSFHITWTSKASADQRAGRAGRMGPGHCYRLYSSAVFNDELEKYSPPEILQRPIDDLILQMKVMNINKVINFPFPSVPDVAQLQTAERRLIMLGALEDLPRDLWLKHVEKSDWTYKVTPLGKSIAAFPVAPRFGKMLAMSYQHDLLPYTITMVAALTVPEVLMEKPTEDSGEKGQGLMKKWMQLRRSWAGKGNLLKLGDPMVLIRAVGASEYAGCTTQFCENSGIRHKAMIEIRKLRKQLTNEANSILPDNKLYVDPKMNPPTDVQAKLLRQILCAGMPDHVAQKVSIDEVKESEDKAKWKYAYRCPEMEEPVFLHSTSMLRHHLPEWVVYQEIYETNKMYMRGVTAIEPEWLPVFVQNRCTMSKPLEDPPPHYDPNTGKVLCHMTSTFGPSAWALPAIEMEYPHGLERYKWFSRFLLEGEVFSKLKTYKDVLLSMPVTMIKSWSNLQPRTELLLKELVSREADCRENLMTAWKQTPKYLLFAYLAWIPESLREEVTSCWPPL